MSETVATPPSAPTPSRFAKKNDEERFTDADILTILKAGESAPSPDEVCAAEGISVETYKAWKDKYAGLSLSQIKIRRRREKSKRRTTLLAALLVVVALGGWYAVRATRGDLPDLPAPAPTKQVQQAPAPKTPAPAPAPQATAQAQGSTPAQTTAATQPPAKGAAQPAAAATSTATASKATAPVATASTQTAAQPAAAQAKPTTPAATGTTTTVSTASSATPAKPAAQTAPPAAAATPSSSKLASASKAATAAATSSSADAAEPRGYSVQVAAMPDKEQAQALVKELARVSYPAYLTQATVNDKLMYRVRVGPIDSRDAAQDMVRRLEIDGHTGAWIAK